MKPYRLTYDMTGYSLDQLLAWCRDDNLIESFERNDEGVMIVRNGQRHRFEPEEAELFLKDIFKGAPSMFQAADAAASQARGLSEEA